MEWILEPVKVWHVGTHFAFLFANQYKNWGLLAEPFNFFKIVRYSTCERWYLLFFGNWQFFLSSTATAVEKLENELSSMSLQSQQLLSSVETAKARVKEPYDNIRQQTTTLAR